MQVSGLKLIILTPGVTTHRSTRYAADTKRAKSNRPLQWLSGERKIDNQRLNATEHHTSMAESTLKSLCSSFKLERDRGVQQLAQVLRDSSEDDIKQLIVSIQSILEDATVSWESKHGVFMAVKVITTHSLDEESTDFVKNAFDETFFGFVQNKAAKLLEDDEFRVRLAAGTQLLPVVYNYNYD